MRRIRPALSDLYTDEVEITWRIAMKAIWVLALAVTGKTGGIAATGAVLWLVARVLYVVVYATGTPVVRTLIWFASIIGLVLMLVRLMS